MKVSGLYGRFIGHVGGPADANGGASERRFEARRRTIGRVGLRPDAWLRQRLRGDRRPRRLWQRGAKLWRGTLRPAQGPGGDGLILIENGTDGADFRMIYVNRTGMDGEMCGNGARCTVLRAASSG
jgi:hypothetical protein